MTNPDIRKTVEELLKREGVREFWLRPRKGTDVEWSNLYNEPDSTKPDMFKVIDAAYVTRLETLVAQLPELIEDSERLRFALQCMIIQTNGPVPGLTKQQVFEGAIDVRDKSKQALANLQRVLGEVGK